MDIEDIKSKGTPEVYVKIKILVSEIIGPARSKPGKAIPNAEHIFVRCIHANLIVSIFVKDDPFPRGVEAGKLPHIEVTDTLTLFDSLQIVERERILSGSHIIELLALVVGVGEGDEAVIHSGADKCHIISEVLRVDHSTTEFNLNTTILHRSHIGKGGREQVRRNRNVVVTKQILLGTVEVVDGTAQPVIQHGEIKTDIPVDTLLPTKVRIDVFGGSPHSKPFALIVVLTIAGHGAKGPIAVEVLISGHTKIGAEFQVIQPVGAALHEIFLRDTPSGRNSREVTPFVVDTELGGSLITE